MRKLIVIIIILLSLIGCSDKISIESSELEFQRVIHIYEQTDSSCGYITELDGDSILVIGENVTDDSQNLHATRLSIRGQNIIDNTIEMGMKVRYVSNGPSFTSYPLIGGLEIVEVIDEDFEGAISLSKDVISEA